MCLFGIQVNLYCTFASMSFLKIIFIVFALISAGTSVGVGYFWQHMAFSAPLAPIQTASTTTAVLHTVADVLSKSATTSPSFHLTKQLQYRQTNYHHCKRKYWIRLVLAQKHLLSPQEWFHVLSMRLAQLVSKR